MMMKYSFMDIRINPNTFFVFDLDDTLYQEIDFLKSAYRYISSHLQPWVKKSIYEEMFTRFENKENVFAWIINEFGELLPDWDVKKLITIYREHIPEIQLAVDTRMFLEKLGQVGIPAGLITDGRSVTQRNKLRALGIIDSFADIIISEEFGSEKPDERNFLHFQKKYPGKAFYYFGDNTIKDFITPKRLGWTTICVKDRGGNIHKQSLNDVHAASYTISGFDEVNLVHSLE